MKNLYNPKPLTGNPFVTLIVSAYNEEQIIRKKLENTLALDYPKDCLEILVVSDCSTDQTDAIVRSFRDQGVMLLRLNERGGKTYGLNQAVEAARGEIIVFSDANAMYEPQSIRKLARHFNDDRIGYVVGDARYRDEDSLAAHNENFYWTYEQFLKRSESKVSSVVGGDGAIYAIRKVLYEPLRRTDINDFVNPLQIITKGYRGIYEPEAVCWEPAAGTYQGEFRRKTRIVNRSLRGLWRVRQVLNPFKYGLFSWQIISHKLIRWFVPFLAIIAFLSNLVLIDFHGSKAHPEYTLFFAIQVLFYVLAIFGHLLVRSVRLSILTVPYYFCLVNLASAIGILRTLRGEVSVTWEPERQKETGTRKQGNKKKKREGKAWKDGKTGKQDNQKVRKPAFTFHVLRLAVYALVVGYVATLIAGLIFDTVAAYVFWGGAGLMVYGYVGYPLILACLTAFRKQSVQQKEIYPTVSLIIPAYNEREVIEDKIKNSLSLHYSPDKLEIVVGSDGSEDGTDEILKAYHGRGITAYCFEKRSGKIGVLNKIFPRIQSDIVVFSDANTLYEPDAIQKLVRNFNDPKVGVASGQVILRNDHVNFGKSENLYYLYERYLQRKETEFGSMLGADGAMYAIRRKLFEKPPDNTILDDFVVPMHAVRSGYRVVYEPEAIGYEDTAPNLKSEFNRKSRIVAGAVQMIKWGRGIPGSRQWVLWFQFISHKFLRWVMPLILIALFLANLRLVSAHIQSQVSLRDNLGIYSVTAAVQIIFYLLALLGGIFKRGWLMTVPQYFCIMCAAFILGLIKGITDRQPVTWKISR